MDKHEEYLWNLKHDSGGRPYTTEEIAERMEEIGDHLRGCAICNRGYEIGPTELFLPSNVMFDLNGVPLFRRSGWDEVPDGLIIPMRPGNFPLSGHRFSSN